MSKPLIILYNSFGLGLIILAPSGVIYTNQAGGVSCCQPEEEGFFVPLHDEIKEQEKILQEYFSSAKRMEHFNEKTADFIDKVLELSLDTRFLKVDRTRLQDSMEAWVYVEIGTQPPERPVSGDGEVGQTASGKDWFASDYPDLPIPPANYPIYGFGQRKGILTWCNSD